MGDNRPWFVIAGGGTGGHLYPGMAVAKALQAVQSEIEVTVFGTSRWIDKKLSEDRGYELVQQAVAPFPSRPWRWPRFVSAWYRSVKEARERFEAREPSVVLGLGGYAAGPPIVAASKLKIPTAIFNPDARPGRANRWLAKRADRVFVQWEETKEHFEEAQAVQVTGCPIRPAFMKATAKKGYQLAKLDPDKLTLLITGASQGAHSVNAMVMELFDLWGVAKDWQILHLTGKRDVEMCRTQYAAHGVAARVLAFTEHMAYCMAAADLVISRAGASTLAEITALGKPSILMPYPFDRKRHQLANAQVLEKHQAAVVIEDTNNPRDNARRIRDELRDIMRSEERRRQMARRAAVLGRGVAAEEMAQALFAMARRGG